MVLVGRTRHSCRIDRRFPGCEFHAITGLPSLGCTRHFTRIPRWVSLFFVETAQSEKRDVAPRLSSRVACEPLEESCLKFNAKRSPRVFPGQSPRRPFHRDTARKRDSRAGAFPTRFLRLDALASKRHALRRKALRHPREAPV